PERRSARSPGRNPDGPASDRPEPTARSSDPARQADAPSAPADIEAAKVVTAPAQPIAPAVPAKPKAASKPPQKTYALLGDVQIAGIKERLRLSASQESYWPAVESALRAVAGKIHATRQTD